MSRILKTRRAKVLGVAMAAMAVAAVAAFAYWTTTGTGTGSGSANTAQTTSLSISQTNTIGPLTPGDSSPIDLSVVNTGPQKQALKGIAVTIASIKKGATDVSSLCKPGVDFTLSNSTINNDQVVAANSSLALPSASDASATPPVVGTGTKLNFVNTGDNQDACKGVTVNLKFDQADIG